MPADGLPEDGALRVGSVSLPPGRRIIPWHGSDPVAWATDQAVPEAGLVWNELSGLSGNTGLVPFLLSGLHGATARPWDQGEFNDPADIGELDGIDPGTLAESMWDEAIPSEEEEEDDDEFPAMYAPFSRRFPGLAPAGERELSPEQIAQALRSLPDARIGLAAARRPADVLPRIGWAGTTNWDSSLLPVAAMLRSWEDRFGARLLRIGFAEIRVLVTHPPDSPIAAQRVAAEHFPFCDECGPGLRSVSEITDYLVDARFWDFWWD
jgi:hypothetical protein